MLKTGAPTMPSTHIIDRIVGYWVVKGYEYPRPSTPE
jgi:hypothetical protein